MVKNRSALDLNKAGTDEIDEPSGSAKLIYELDAVGGKKLVESQFHRLDEGMFDWKGASTPVRWVRDLQIEEKNNTVPHIEYKDLYIVRTHDFKESYRDPKIDIRIHADGSLNDPQSVKITIGIPVGKSEHMFDDQESGVQVLFYDIPNSKRDDVLTTLKSDPNYAFLFEGGITKEKVMTVLKQKADLLTQDWDKMTPVFAAQELKAPQPVLE